jgi:hypothetical protein
MRLHYQIGLVIGENCVTWVILKKSEIYKIFVMNHPSEMKGSELEALLLKNTHLPLWVLTNTADQFFEKKTIPPLNLWDRYFFLKNIKLPSTDKEGKAFLQLSSATLIMATIPITSAVSSWFNFLQNLFNPISVLSCLGIEGLSLFRYISPLPQDGLLLISSTSQSLRHIVISQGEFVFSRLTFFQSPDDIVKDITYTLSYMRHKSISDYNIFILEKELLSLYPSATLLSSTDILKTININPKEVKCPPDALCLIDLMYRKKAFLSFEHPAFQKKQRLVKYTWLVHQITIGILLTSCILGGILFFQIDQANNQLKLFQSLVSQIEASSYVLPIVKEEREELFKKLDSYYQKASAAPSSLPFYKKLIAILPRQWRLGLLTWSKESTQEKFEVKLYPCASIHPALNPDKILLNLKNTFSAYKIHILKSPDHFYLQEDYESSRSHKSDLHLVFTKKGSQ